MDSILQSLADEPLMILTAILALPGMALAAFIVWVIGAATVRCRRETEQSRREVAAYVAEGSITADDAESILSPRPPWARSLEKSAASCKAGFARAKTGG